MHQIRDDRKLKNEVELENSIRWMARMYAMRDSQVAEPLYTPQMRAEQAEDTSCMIHKIEGEVAEYLARKYGYAAQSAEEVSAAQRAGTDAPTEQAA